MASGTSRGTLQAIGTRVELPVMRRLLSVMEGRHSSERTGRGMEFRDMAVYQRGDDVKDIDWKATARAGEPIVKRRETTANVQMMLVVDAGRSMGALAPSGESKNEVALEACRIVAWLASMRGDQVGMVAGDSRRLRHVPARSGNQHAEMILRQLKANIDLTAPPSDMHRLLTRAFAATRRRSLIVIVTDETRPQLSDEQALKRLTVRHRVIVMQVGDMLAASLPKGTEVIDVNAGQLPEFVIGDKKLAEQAAIVARQRKQTVSEMLARVGVTQVSMDSVAAVPGALVTALERSGRAH